VVVRGAVDLLGPCAHCIGFLLFMSRVQLAIMFLSIVFFVFVPSIRDRICLHFWRISIVSRITPRFSMNANKNGRQ
jgi:hypothetical protein